MGKKIKRRNAAAKPDKTDGKVKKKELTEKEKLFCQVYINNFNAASAVIRAGYNPKDRMNASRMGYELLEKAHVCKEITRLKKEKMKAMNLSKDDIVERFMRIAFADMTDFIDFGREDTPVMTMFGPMMETHPVTGRKEIMTKEVNTLKFKEGSMVDGALICQIKQGKDGASIKLEDRQRALEWLADYFDMNPKNRHKQEYDKRKIEIDLIKAESQLNKTSDNPENLVADDGFMEALTASAKEVWSDVNTEDSDDLGED